MASTLEEDLSCPICQEFFRDPVVLSCSHSFCKVCLENWWKDKPIKTCPLCKRRSSKDHPPSNLALRNLVETYLEQRGQTPPEEPLCSVHSEKLRLFCLDHQQLVCLVCRDSRTHKDHRFSPIDEAAQDLREELQTSIKSLKHKLLVLNERKVQFDEAAAHISAQARQTEKLIRDQFQKLQQFLLEEEKSRMKPLREEEEQKTQRMKVKMATVSRDIAAVSKTIAETEELLRATDISFLLQHKTAVERVQRCPLVEEPEMEPGALIDQAKHLGNLGFNIWSNMKRLVQFYPVVLDPNRAASELILSEDLTSVRFGDKQKLPKNPERYKVYNVEGSEGFISGTHSWDVKVSDKKDWVVGVRGCVQREEDIQGGVWYIGFKKGEYRALSYPGSVKPLSVEKMQKIRVKLDFSRKTVSFTDPDTNTDLHTFADTFTGEQVPLLATKKRHSFKDFTKKYKGISAVEINTQDLIGLFCCNVAF